MFSFVTNLVFALSFFSFCFFLKMLGEKKVLRLGLNNIFFSLTFISLINCFSVFSGVNIPLSLFSLATSVILGIPGILTLVFFRIFF